MAGRRDRARAQPRSLTERRAEKAEVDDPAVVLEAALRFLEARQRSVAEVRRRLTRAGYRDELVSGAVERLADLGILDDEAFARSWVESRDRAHPRGEHALMLELRQKGIDATIVAAVLRERRETATRWDAPGATSHGAAAGARDPGDADDAAAPATPDEAAARRLLARHARALERVPDPRQRRRKAYALLARNGFSPEIAGSAARALVAVDTDASTEPEPDA